ncbi:MAG: acetyltransferase [bacterium]|nr:MAG: acetyltransferase [bacterium]
MNIRYANENDSELLANLGHKTFYETFAEHNTPEDMASYLSVAFSVEKQICELKDPNAIFLIAEIEGTVVGYAKLRADNKCDSITGRKPIEMERIYSLKDYIGKGIGAKLMQASIKEAKDRGFDCLWLGVWERNERAILFYEKWGFNKVGSHVFMLGTDPQSDFIMQLLLT